MPENHFGEVVAARYDGDLAEMFEASAVEPAVEFLAELAGEIEVAIGDFATTRVEGRFTLVYLVYNTINNLVSLDEQVACFRNAAAHLAPGGRFVIEVTVPQLRRLAPGESVFVFHMSQSHLGLNELDPVTQRMVSHHYRRGEDGKFELRSIPFRYVWPSELDLMARLAGMTLVGRWDGWSREPFTAESTSHVSVWQKPDDPAPA